MNIQKMGICELDCSWLSPHSNIYMNTCSFHNYMTFPECCDSFAVLTIRGIKAGIIGLQWSSLISYAHTLRIKIQSAHDTDLNFCLASLTKFGGFLCVWLPVQLWRGQMKGWQTGGKPPVRKQLDADPNSNMVEMGSNNREIVPIAFGSPKWPASGIQFLQKENTAVWLLHISNPNLIFYMKASLYRMRYAYRLEASREFVFEPM